MINDEKRQRLEFLKDENRMLKGKTIEQEIADLERENEDLKRNQSRNKFEGKRRLFD